MNQKDQHKERWHGEIKILSSEHENQEVILNQRTMHEFSSQKVQIKWWQARHGNIEIETAHNHIYAQEN